MDARAVGGRRRGASFDRATLALFKGRNVTVASVAGADEPTMKGALVRGFLDWFEATQDRRTLDQMYGHLPADVRALVDPSAPGAKLLAGSWYPVRIVHAVLDAIARNQPQSRLERIAHDTARFFVERNMNGPYRFAIRALVTPDVYAMSIPRFWRQVHSSGSKTFRILGPGQGEANIRDWPAHHPLMCLMTIESTCAFLELTGCKDVTWRLLSCVSRGGSECAHRVVWK